MKKKLEICISGVQNYYKRKYKTSKLYRVIIKLYGYLSLFIFITAASALDYHPIGALLWIAGMAAGFILLNIMFLTLDLLGVIVYTFLEPRYKQQELTSSSARRGRAV